MDTKETGCLREAAGHMAVNSLSRQPTGGHIANFLNLGQVTNAKNDCFFDLNAAIKSKNLSTYRNVGS